MIAQRKKRAHSTCTYIFRARQQPDSHGKPSIESVCVHILMAKNSASSGHNKGTISPDWNLSDQPQLKSGYMIVHKLHTKLTRKLVGLSLTF
jgi:hypothetical protein